MCLCSKINTNARRLKGSGIQLAHAWLVRGTALVGQTHESFTEEWCLDSKMQNLGGL